MRRLLPVVLAVVLAACATRPDEAGTPAPARPPAVDAWSGAPPHWIWVAAAPGDGETVALERRFDVPRPIARATLRGSADNRVRAFLNGEEAAAHDDWNTAFEADVSTLVRRGENVLVLVARNDGGPAAAWAELVVEDPSGRRVRVVTDASWSAARCEPGIEFSSWSPGSRDDARTGPAHDFGAFGVAPWIGAARGPRREPRPDPPAASPVQRALPAAAIELPDGFRAELVHEVPRDTQGSWVALCEDPRGRFYASDQHGRLFRVTPAPAGADASRTRVEDVAVDIGSAHGLLWAFDSLYVVVSERDPGRVCGLYRLRDTDGDDRLDSARLLREFHGGGEHGPHAVRLGPDGRLWIVGGNHTDLPEPIDASRVPRTWAEDLLLPRIDDPNGHAVGRMAPGGWIAATDADGARWELVAAGLRNAYDIAFDPGGELFTFDSDMEWDVGAPWYRPTRVLHVVSGADFGWRQGSGKWPADWPDTWPSACDLSRTSPTGVEFGTDARFPEPWRSALFVCDWAFGTMYAVHLSPDGASWRGDAEVFARGEPFQVTDLVVARDGALYVATGGRNTQSALYRISWTGPADAAPARGPRLTGAQRARRELEALHAPRPRNPAELESIARGLDSADGFLARAARVALEHTPPEQRPAIRERCRSARQAAGLVLAELHAGTDDPARTLRTLERLEQEPGGLLRVDLLRLWQLALLRIDVPDATRAGLRRRIALAWPSGSARVDAELAALLAHLQAPGLVVDLLERIASASTQEEALHHAYCLRVVESGWTAAQRERFLDFLDGPAAAYTGGESLRKYVGRIREEFVARIPVEERAALAARLAPAAAPAAPAAAPAPFVRRWTRPELEALIARPLHGRPPERGRDAYHKATCATCHRMGDVGGGTGPDLTATGSRFSAADLLEALIEPSRTISDQYQDVEVRTVDGDLYVGRVESEHGSVVRLRRAPGDELVEIDADAIEMRRPYPLSRMPSGLLDVLDEEEVLDLLAYLRAATAPR